MKVEAAMAQIEVVGASEKEALKRSKATQKEIDELKDSTEADLKRAHMVESAQKSAALILQETDIKTQFDLQRPTTSRFQPISRRQKKCWADSNQHSTCISGNINELTLWNEMATDSLKKVSGLQLSSTSATHYYLDPNIPETYHIKQQHGQLTDTTSFLNVNNQRYEDPDQERTRNHFPLETLLEVNPQNYQVPEVHEMWKEGYNRSPDTQMQKPWASSNYSLQLLLQGDPQRWLGNHLHNLRQ
ncbi:hypothetical protein Tco_0185679 [Tanacetum coccineum]